MLRDREICYGTGIIWVWKEVNFYFYQVFTFFTFILYFFSSFFRFDNSRQQENAHQSALFAATVCKDEELNKVGSFRVFLFQTFNFLNFSYSQMRPSHKAELARNLT